MSKIIGIENMTGDQLERELNRGGRFVMFPYCISIIVMTFKQHSDIYFIRAGESTFPKSLLYFSISLFLGWWGIPWGPIYTIGSLFSNLTGGKDVTQEVVQSIINSAQEQSQTLEGLEQSAQGDY